MDRTCVRALARPNLPLCSIFATLVVCPPIGKEKRYPDLTLTVIHATERGTPKDRDPISERFRLANLVVAFNDAAIPCARWRRPLSDQETRKACG